MKAKSTLRVFLAIAGSTLFAITCASAATYYWDGNDGTSGFEDATPGPVGTWSASTPSTATGGFTTDSTGGTAISANPAVATTTNDDIIFGTGSTTDLPPLYPFTGTITIDGTVNAKSITCSANHPTFVAGTSPVINFPAEGRFEHATEGTITLPVMTLTGASTSMTWKAGFIDNLVIENVINNASKNIFEGTGSFIAIKGGPELGPAGTPIVLNGGGLRLSSGFPYSTMSAFNAVYPITVNPNVSFGLAPFFGSAFTLDTTLGLGTGGLYIAGQNANSPVIITAPQTHTGGTFMVSSIAEISDNAQLGDITSPLVFGSGPSGTGEGANGTLRITGTAMTSLGARPLVHTPDKTVAFDIADAANTFTLDKDLTQGAGGFTKTGAGTLIINTTTSTYTGTTTVNGGSLTIQGDHSGGGGWTIANSAAATAVTFATGSTISVGAGNNVGTANGGGSAGRAIVVAGAVTTSSTSNLSIYGRNSVSINSGGSWDMQGGTLTIQPLNSGYGATLNVNSGGSFTYSGTKAIIVSESTSSNSGTGNLNLRGTFTTTTGFRNTGAGTNATATSNFNFLGGTLKISNDITAIFESGGQPFNITTGTGGGIIDTNGFNTATSLGISGAGGLTKAGAGTLTLSGTNTYAGDTSVTGGTLVLAADNTSNDSSAVTISGTGVLQLTFAGSDNVDKLFIGTTQQAAGTYGHSSTGATNGGLGVGALDALFAEGTGTLTVASNPTGSPFQIFMAAYPGLTGDDALPEADPDGDGLSNVAEFIMGGTAPNSGSVANRPVHAEIGGHLTISMLVPSGTTFAGSPSPSASVQGVQVAVGGSLDLATFTRSVEETALNPGLPGAPSGYEWHTFRLSDPISSQSSGFLRGSFNIP